MIELSRNITFGQYINNGSPLSRMDPRTKLICAVLLIALTSIASSFVSFAIFLLFCVVIQRQSRISTSYVLGSFKPFLWFLVVIYIIEIAFYYAPDQHQTVYWHWLFISISKEGIITSTLVMIRVLFLYYLVSMLMFTTSMVDLTDGMDALLAPLQKLRIPVGAFTMVLVIAFKFVPIFVTEVERLIKAQSARGVRFDQGNVFQRARKLAPLFVPLFVSGFQRANVLSTAMEARCYGRPGQKRTKRRALRIQRYDAFVLITTIIACAIVFAVSFISPF
ncbi:energy-coupling factor transporter transmembrane protein EcfT [Ktedonosporobacter rubrisoli]|uniref:Energy-coupling factor transporter transmembrane protein EcfT n=1 Tax=Ktedonosporobacter rubrisoli TaxID=2509675 RepID=A0A4P6K1S8_KTERU|nr:energy-coupling factor transporter transmembrane component T [Ktedonosporobacter rubrisoli]QBD81832.1 energy-coupling factor transporter transmembrane protein EcfT [Ktedonosporobacter rubrisoli]